MWLTLLFTATIAVFLIWTFFSFWQLRWVHRLPRLALTPAPDQRVSARSGLCSIVIAARDEESRIEKTIHHLLSQEGVKIEVIVVDDRSRDHTWDILRRMAMKDPRVRVKRVEVLPAGWLGKCHACHVGATVATGDWILFTDADCWLRPDVIARALLVADRDEADHITLTPGIVVASLAVRAWYLLFLTSFLNWIAGVNRDRPKAHIGLGAFNLVRASAYRECGGYEALRLSVLDDVRLGLLLSRAGKRTRAFLGADDVECHWGATLREMIRVMEKNYFAILEFRLWLVLLGIGSVTLVIGIFLLGLMTCTPAGLTVAMCPLLLILPALVLARRLGWAWYCALGVPLMVPVFMYALLNSTFVTLRQGGVRWRDTFYSLKQLRAGGVLAVLVFAAFAAPGAGTNGLTTLPAQSKAGTARRTNIPEMVEADGSLRFDYGDEILILPGGLQPSLLRTASGSLVVQAQIPRKAFDSARMHYPWAMETRISRDDGKKWLLFPAPPNENGVNIEGGAIQLHDGTILALDTYITPGKREGEGIGQLYTSTNDWQTLEGPEDVSFQLPGAQFYGSKDDGGHPHDAQRLHRRILELPNGHLLTTYYGWMKGDATPSTYMPSMIKSRVVLVRSQDRGRHWQLVSTVAVDPALGTEGLGEPVLARLAHGPKRGRLLCLMRTGRELRESFSDDEGATWSPNRPRVFAGLDVYRTELWVDHFRNFKGSKGKLLDENNADELRGAVVDPDLVELRSGLLVAAFGIRIPQKACWAHPDHPWNGNYLACSTDHGETWSNVVRLTSGVRTTHYMAIEETLSDNKLFLTYDLGSWSKNSERDAWGRFVQVTPKSKPDK
jgi:glycosyltransferase involved in cell wall biosynthesis